MSATFLARVGSFSARTLSASSRGRSLPRRHFGSRQRLVSGVPYIGVTRAYSSATSTESTVDSQKTLLFEDTPLGSNGSHLLDGLDLFSVEADDGHPLAVYGIGSSDPVQYSDSTFKKPILLLHGRTWSAVPVYHLLGGPTVKASGKESRSLMEALLAKGLQPYCMDFRGFGGTHKDSTGCVIPGQCVHDAETVLRWISDRHGMQDAPKSDQTALLGWSQGALVAQLMAQKQDHFLSKLILYGSIYDPMVRYPREPLYRLNKPNVTTIENQFDDAIEDFTLEGSIPPEPARTFAEAALVSDPIKAVWGHLYHFNNCDPARVIVPTLVVAGDQDPYASLYMQQELFRSLGRGADRTWSILSDCDHAVHLLEGRARLINIIVSFVQNGKRSEP